MSVRLFYIDESYDNKKFCLSAISIRHADWHECFTQIKNHRIRLKNDYGIFLSKEIHARDLVAGRGKISKQTITKWERTRIYKGLLQLIACLPNVKLFNICLDKKPSKDIHLTAWDRLINRIERTMLAYEEQEIPIRNKLIQQITTKIPSEDVEKIELRLNAYRARAIIIADEGKEIQITSALRRMHTFNPIPSKYGSWPTGTLTKNIVTERIIEDPFFKQSHRSYFVQLADCVAYALLKKETVPTDHIKKYGINKMFEEVLSGKCFLEASRSDSLGIVRK